MTTVPHQPIRRPAYIDRGKAADRKTTAMNRCPEAREVSDTLEQEGPRAALNRCLSKRAGE